jgi:hypothetical protein
MRVNTKAIHLMKLGEKILRQVQLCVYLGSHAENDGGVPTDTVCSKRNTEGHSSLLQTEKYLEIQQHPVKNEN